MLGACENFDFGVDSILVKGDDNEYMQAKPTICYANNFFSGLESIKFNTEDKTIDLISLMGNNMNPTAVAVGEKYTYFLSDH